MRSTRSLLARPGAALVALALVAVPAWPLGRAHAVVRAGAPAGAPLPPHVLDIVRDLLAGFEFPEVTVGINPRRGLTGLASWFWLEGDDGRPRRIHHEQANVSVDVEVALDRVRWTVGDGATFSGGRGQPYPRPSEVVHTYERRGHYTVTADLVYAVRARVRNGPWQGLDPVIRRVSRPYDVIEVRSILANR